MNYVPSAKCQKLTVAQWEEMSLLIFEGCYDYYDLIGRFLVDEIPFSSN